MHRIRLNSITNQRFGLDDYFNGKQNVCKIFIFKSLGHSSAHAIPHAVCECYLSNHIHIYVK